MSVRTTQLHTQERMRRGRRFQKVSLGQCAGSCSGLVAAESGCEAGGGGLVWGRGADWPTDVERA